MDPLTRLLWIQRIKLLGAALFVPIGFLIGLLLAPEMHFLIGLALLLYIPTDLLRRWKAKSFAKALEQDNRPPVVYLRSFESDEGTFSNITDVALGFGKSENNEVALARIMNKIGPLVAIGRPGQYLPNRGAARLYVCDGEWQNAVDDLLLKAKLVVIRMGYTEGLMWELRRIVAVCQPTNIILYNPYRSVKGEAEFHATYDMFRESVLEIFPKGIPFSLRPVEAYGFRTDWSVVRRRFNRSLSAFFRRKAAGSKVSELLEDLRPILLNGGVDVPVVGYSLAETVWSFLYVTIRIGLIWIVFEGFSITVDVSREGWSSWSSDRFWNYWIGLALLIFSSWVMFVRPVREFLWTRSVCGRVALGLF